MWKPTDKQLSVIGTLGSLAAAYCLAPEKAAIGAAVTVVSLAGAIVFAKGRWV